MKKIFFITFFMSFNLSLLFAETVLDRTSLTITNPKEVVLVKDWYCFTFYKAPASFLSGLNNCYRMVLDNMAIDNDSNLYIQNFRVVRQMCNLFYKEGSTWGYLGTNEIYKIYKLANEMVSLSDEDLDKLLKRYSDSFFKTYLKPGCYITADPDQFAKLRYHDCRLLLKKEESEFKGCYKLEDLSKLINFVKKLSQNFLDQFDRFLTSKKEEIKEKFLREYKERLNYEKNK